MEHSITYDLPVPVRLHDNTVPLKQPMENDAVHGAMKPNPKTMLPVLTKFRFIPGLLSKLLPHFYYF